jgi:hypothetical protein
MYRKEAWIKVFLLLGTFFFILGCQGTKVIVEREPSPKPFPSYKKGGPPPWAPAYGYRAKHKYRYYPRLLVSTMIESAESIFITRMDSGGGSVSLPSSIRIDFNDYVTLAMNASKPYEWDHEVSKR